MSDYEWDDDEPIVVIEKNEPGIGTFLVGLAVGAGLALLFAPRSGEETRREVRCWIEMLDESLFVFVFGVEDRATAGQALGSF